MLQIIYLFSNLMNNRKFTNNNLIDGIIEQNYL